MEQNELIPLINRYLDGSATEAEQEQVLAFYQSFQHETLWKEEVEGSKDAAIAEVVGRIKEGMVETPEQAPSIEPYRQRTTIRKSWMRYAAAIILLIAGAGSLLVLQPWNKLAKETFAYKPLEDIKPSSKESYLTLGDGSIVKLKDLKPGQKIGTATVAEDGKLVYENAADQPVVRNTVTVPRGAEPRRIELPDGTEVWLNSASSISYPTAFTGKVREVIMTGESDYEVTKTGTPFTVQTPTDKIEVMGTHFNIHAYGEDGAVKTTLLNGKVKIGNTVLAPGEQYEKGQVKKLDDAALRRVMAWKNGLFSYEKVDVQTLMRDLGRVYDVEVVFEGEPTKRTFRGAIDRSLSLKDVLEGLAFKRVNFRLEQGPNGNRIVMLP